VSADGIRTLHPPTAGSSLSAVTRVLVIVLVILATVAGAGTALATFHRDYDLDVGSVRVSVDPGHDGALDLYVPLVDWGVRFPRSCACPPGSASTCARSIATPW